MFYGTYQRLGVHIWGSNLTLIRAARKKLKPEVLHSRAHRNMRHSFYKRMIEFHQAEQRLCIRFRL